jgi:hypothetical protein
MFFHYTGVYDLRDMLVLGHCRNPQAYDLLKNTSVA